MLFFEAELLDVLAYMESDKESKIAKKRLKRIKPCLVWFGFVDAFHRKECGYP